MKKKSPRVTAGISMTTFAKLGKDEKCQHRHPCENMQSLGVRDRYARFGKRCGYDNS